MAAASGRLRQVLLRHFRTHGRDFEPGRVEDAAVISAPICLEPVVVGDVGLAGAGGEAEFLAIPMGAAIRGQDRPRHGRKAAHEKRPVGFNDVVVGLEPAHVACSGRVGDFAEAHEGAHLVGVAPHGLREAVGPVDVGVGGDFEQVLLSAMRTPDEAVKQGEALWVAVLNHRFGQCDKGARHRERARRSGRRRPGRHVAEQVVGLADRPRGFVGRHIVEGQPAGGGAPGIPVDFVGEYGRVHRS